MKIGSKQIKTRYVFLVLAAIAYYLWSLPPAEIRPILKASEKVKEEYEAGIKQAMLNGKDEVYLKDIITSVKWDRVCAFTGYYNKPRDELKNRAEGDYPVLSYYDDDYSPIMEGPGRIIFIGNKKILASFEYKYGLENHGCTSFDKTKIIFHKPLKVIVIKSKDEECNADPMRNCDKIDYKKSFEQRESCNILDLNEDISNCNVTLTGE